jgi:tryptophanyl-tRNA synthetase
MSKSRPAGCLFIDDEENIITKKIMSAVTDSDNKIIHDIKKKPGISNLLDIASSLSTKSVKDLEHQFRSSNYGEFKKYIAKMVIDYFAPIRAKKIQLLKNPKKILSVFASGAKIANIQTNAKIKIIKNKIGLI